jgi:DNA-binding transcriptional ArsR family regulator
MVKYKTGDIFAALGQPVRREMVERLARQGSMSISEMAKPFKISLPATLKHTQILERSGLIVREKKGRVQFCTIHTKAFEEVTLWLVAQKSFWDSSFDRLERHITNRKKK